MVTPNATGAQYRAPAPALSPATAPAEDTPQPVAPDAVYVRITSSVQRDYSERGVFQHLQMTKVIERSREWTSYLVPHGDALLMLEDAKVRRDLGGKGKKTAYKSLAGHLEGSIESADKRMKILAAKQATRIDAWPAGETWRGSKAQLQASGIGVGIAFPGEPGGNRRRVQTMDSRGYVTRISVYNELWSLFEACVDIPASAQETKEEEKRALDLEQRQLAELKYLPPNRQAFRDREAARFHRKIDLVLTYLQPQAGYRFSDAAKEKFLDACCDAFEVLKHGEVIGESPAVAIQRIAAEHAKRNAPLQAFLAQAEATARAAGPQALGGAL